MKGSTVGVLLFVALLVGLSASEYSTNSNNQNNQNNRRRSQDDQEGQQENAKPFQAGYQYTYSYNGQIASGLSTTTLGGNSQQDEPQQKAVTRIQAQAKISFQQNSATLRLQQIRVGQANQHIDDETEVQPMDMFDRKPLEEDKRRQLEMPVQFEYRQGVVGRIQFQREDPTWSRNAKRAVLNLIQANLAAQQATSQYNSGEQDEQQSSKSKGKSFTLPEITIEGDCQTTYTITKNPKGYQGQQDNNDQQQGQEFNVTKTINFQQCKKIADVAYGYQTQAQQPECVKCQQPWKQQEQQQQNDQQDDSTPTKCQQKCDPKEVKQQDLERRTMIRLVLQSKQQGQMPSRQQDYAIQRAELISQYVYKNLQTDTATQSSSAMQTVVTAQLVFRRAEQKQDEGQDMQQTSSHDGQKSNTLLYDNQFDVEEKRFYQLGDESGKTSPFEQVTNKVEQAQQMLRKLIQATAEKQKGIEFDQVAQLQRLVEVFRMCTVDELQQITSSSSRSSARSEGDQMKQEQLVADTLAMAGTRNTIKVLADMITSGKLHSTQAFQALKSLQSLPAPSDEQAELVLQLCRNQAVHRSAALKQTCWLTFGSVVSEVCQQKQGQENQLFGTQTGFHSRQQMCSTEKQDTYKQALMEQYKQAENTYEKVLALKAIGNAGLENTIHPLESIISSPRNERFVRAQAIDSLRRLPAQMAKKVQRVLLPIFQNTKEHPEIRMAAFCMIMRTLPEQQILDQISYTLIKERQPEVQALVYTTMKAFANSKVPAEQQIAKHLQSILKMTNVDEQQLRPSRMYRVPIYSQEQNEGVFLTLVSAFRNSRSQLPSHVAVGLDTLLNDQYQISSLKVSASQQGIEQWYESLLQAFVKMAKQQQEQHSEQQQRTRGERTGSSSSSSSSYNDNKDQLRQIFSGLKIKSRQGGYRSKREDSQEQQQQQQRGIGSNGYNSQKNQPFAMVCVRVGNVDQAILPIDQQSMPQCLKQLISGERMSLSSLMEKLRDTQHFRMLTAINLKEKSARIPTSMGIPLRILKAIPVMAAIEGNVKVNIESGGKVKVQLNVHPSGSVACIQKMEIWMPIVATGVECTRAVEINAPIQSEIEADSRQGLKVTLQTPQAPKTRVFGIHTLPSTYTREWDSKTKMLREPKVKSIHNQQLEQLQKDMNKRVGEHSVGLPFQLHGHYHWPAGRISDYKKLVQLLMATENHVHMTFEPQQDSTPKQIIFRVSGSAFQKSTQGRMEDGPELNNFYSKDSAFEKAHPEDNFDDMQLDGHEQRSQKLNSFLDSFQPKQMYQHSIKVDVETRGGRKQCRAQMELKAACDAQFKFCKAKMDIQRTAMLPQENGEWSLNANVQVLAPETVTNIDQLNGGQKHPKLICKTSVEWGTERKQSITMRIQGEQALSRQQRQQIEQQGSQSQSYLKKRAAFLNKFDLQAEYKLQPQSQNYFARVLELVKCQDPWNTGSQYLQSGRDGQVHATLLIDPLNAQQANISVKTPTQAVRMEAVEMQLLGSEAMQMRPFPLVRSHPKQSHSTHQLFRRMAESQAPRAECKVDGKRVQTFDGAEYKAPIGKCYSVLAKDCSNDQDPKFAVMMKSVGGQQQQQQGQRGGQQQQDKKIKVITPEQTIECQPSGQGSSKKLQCKANGQMISGNNQQSSYSSKESNSDNNVEYSGEDQQEVTIRAEGVQVRFACHCADCKCQQAWIRLSSHYKQTQCGLCGHHDDEDNEEEWKMANGDDQSSQQLDQFHRSYSLRNDNEDGCNEEEQNSFYSPANKNKFRHIKSSRAKKSIYGDDDEDEQQQQQSEESQQDEQWRNGGYQSEDSSEEQQQWKKQGKRGQQQQKRRGQRQNGQDEEPIEQTKVLEYNHKICFSTQPVKQCPEGTRPSKSTNPSNNNNGNGNNSDEWDSDDSQQQQGANTKKIQFACLSRSSSEARRMQRQARQGVKVDVSSLSPSFVEPVQQSTRCVPY